MQNTKRERRTGKDRRYHSKAELIAQNNLIPEKLYSPFDKAIEYIQDKFFCQHKVLTLTIVLVLYVSIVLLFGNKLQISINYFVLFPVILISASYGLPYSIIIGALGLPANLFLFHILKHPEYSPASKIIAEISGIIVGLSIGYLSDYYRKLTLERALRIKKEKELQCALIDKEILFREVHHRVKNNLNTIKSIISLQARRSSSEEFKEAANTLINRIMSISFIHERLYRTSNLSFVFANDYLENMVKAIISGASYEKYPPKYQFSIEEIPIPIDTAVSIGLIVNEVITNALKHNSSSNYLEIKINLQNTDNNTLLTISDNGIGFENMPEGSTKDISAIAQNESTHLGITIIKLMCEQLNGQGYFERKNSLTIFNLKFCLEDLNNTNKKESL